MSANYLTTDNTGEEPVFLWLCSVFPQAWTWDASVDQFPRRLLLNCPLCRNTPRKKMWAVCIIINGFRMQISFIVFQLHQNFNRSLARSNPRCQVQSVGWPFLSCNYNRPRTSWSRRSLSFCYPHDLDSCVVRDAPTSRRIHQ